VQSALVAALTCAEGDHAGMAAALDAVEKRWLASGYRLNSEAASREGGLWLLSPREIASRRRSAPVGGPPWQPYGASPYSPLYETSPYGDSAYAHVGGLTSDPSSRSRTAHFDERAGWQKAGECGAVPGALRRVICPKGDSDRLPAEAKRLLSSHMCFVLENSQLWPSALDRFGDASFLASSLQNVSCHVLSAPCDSKEFAYFLPGRKFSSLAQANAAGSDRILANYRFEKPDVAQLNLPIHSFLDSNSAHGRCLYLQHPILRPAPPPPPPTITAAPHGNGFGLPGLELTPGMGARMAEAVADLRLPLLRQMEEAVGVGQWTVCQLFVGNSATAGAHTRMHFDQYDNFYLQVSGTKTFRLFDPTQAGHLSPYPVHHRMDRSAQAVPPRADAARGTLVTLRAGDVLFLPAYWWHEVTTGPLRPGELAVSVNFWYSAMDMILSPCVPLRPPLRVELARQLEHLISDSFGDAGRMVPAFLAALRAQVEATVAAPRANANQPWWPELDARRPSGVRAADWAGLMEYVLWRLLMLLEPQHVRPFLADLCDPARFERLALSR
jgi:hypoxia-inducible factor 1-alpha inhibitor (HIF hydroxylase)